MMALCQTSLSSYAMTSMSGRCARNAADNSAALRSLKVACAATVRSHIKSRRRGSLNTDRGTVVAIEKPEYWNQHRKQLMM